jgi:regulator of protease activity HflC (stomatin/prohibitin superfamily)
VSPTGLPGRERQASVVLREEGESVAHLMDPANRSLADALKITFRLLQLAMVVLFGLFAFSGLQPVQEGESGLRLVFGALVERDVPPGMRFALPPPVGEIVRVSTNGESIEDASAFYPMVPAEVRAQGADALPYNSSLNPARDGSIVTGDQAIAHVIMAVQYRRTDPAQYAENILDDATEDMLVISAARQGMVRACAEITIDELLREQQAGAIAARAQEVAQRTLDQAESGITIERINLIQRVPPRYLQASFNKVQNAQSAAGKLLEEARTAANQTLNAVAGLASDHLIELIEDYDRAMQQQAVLASGGLVPEGERLDADAILADIDAMLEGRPVTIGGETIANLISGEATGILQQAAVDRARLVNGRQADLQMFLAKLEQYRQNPSVMVHNEWGDGVRALTSRDFVQQYLAPLAGPLHINIDQDARWVDQMERALKEAETRDAAQRRMDEFIRGQSFSTPTGTPLRADPG